MSEALLLTATFWIDADPRPTGVACLATTAPDAALTVTAPDVVLTISEDC